MASCAAARAACCFSAARRAWTRRSRPRSAGDCRSGLAAIHALAEATDVQAGRRVVRARVEPVAVAADVGLARVVVGQPLQALAEAADPGAAQPVEDYALRPLAEPPEPQRGGHGRLVAGSRAEPVARGDQAAGVVAHNRTPFSSNGLAPIGPRGAQRGMAAYRRPGPLTEQVVEPLGRALA